MHLRGKSALYVAYYPDGTQETLLDVPKYDYNWQIIYRYNQMKKVPAGTRLEVTMGFDNSPERAAQANLNSNRHIRFGGPTTEEMMLGFLDYTETAPQDFELEAALFADEDTSEQ